MYNKIYKKSIIDINDNMVGKIFKTFNCGDVIVLGKIPSKYTSVMQYDTFCGHIIRLSPFVNLTNFLTYQNNDIMKSIQ